MQVDTPTGVLQLIGVYLKFIPIVNKKIFAGVLIFLYCKDVIQLGRS